jgi:O-antigen/teichoic acid export membrane protein
MSKSAPGLFFLLRVLTGLVGIGTPILLARSLSVTDFTNYASILAASGLMLVITDLGLDRACLRLLPKYAGAVSARELLFFLGTLSLLRMLALSLVLAVVVATGAWLPLGSGTEYSAFLLVAISLSMGASQLVSAFMQGLLLQAFYAIIVFITVILRFTVLVVFYFQRGALSHELVIEVFIGIELLSLLAQSLTVGAFALKWSTPAIPAVSMPSLHDVLTVSRANYLSYLAGIPLMGNSLVLLVGYYCNLEITAAFAFFQNLVDRGRQFMPVRLMQSLVEPQWARLHGTDGRIRRFRVPLAVLQKANALPLSFGLALIVAVGDPLLRQITRPLYADNLLLLALILIQQATGSIAELLWMGSNATNQIAKLTRGFALVSVCATLLLIPTVKFVGAAGLIVWTWMPPLMLLVLLRHVRVSFASLPHQTHKTVLMLVVGLVAGTIGRYVETMTGMSPQFYAPALLVSTGAWLTMMLYLKPFNRAERYVLSRFVYSRETVSKSSKH